MESYSFLYTCAGTSPSFICWEQRDQKALFAWSVLNSKACWKDKNSSRIIPRYLYSLKKNWKDWFLTFNSVCRACVRSVLGRKFMMADSFELTWMPHLAHQSCKFSSFLQVRIFPARMARSSACKRLWSDKLPSLIPFVILRCTVDKRIEKSRWEHTALMKTLCHLEKFSCVYIAVYFDCTSDTRE